MHPWMQGFVSKSMDGQNSICWNIWKWLHNPWKESHMPELTLLYYFQWDNPMGNFLASRSRLTCSRLTNPFLVCSVSDQSGGKFTSCCQMIQITEFCQIFTTRFMTQVYSLWGGLELFLPLNYILTGDDSHYTELGSWKSVTVDLRVCLALLLALLSHRLNLCHPDLALSHESWVAFDLLQYILYPPIYSHWSQARTV